VPNLHPSAYVVLGLLVRHGPATPYRLDRAIQGSIGYFWGFPRSQLYAEAARLTRLGLVTETREDSGRRRRSLAITPAGRAELAGWLARPAEQPTELRDEGLLRLYFADAAAVPGEGGPGPAAPGSGERDARTGDGEVATRDADVRATVRRLAAEQEAAHRGRLAGYERLVASGRLPDGSVQRATLEFGLRFEHLAVAFWAGVVADPPGPPP
jgi:PadR family transcriptional regulator AphA